jgi:lysophospholipase L1-like esterase
VRTKFPSIPIVWIAISPNERRWKVWNEISEANTLIANYCKTNANLHFVDTDEQLLRDGKPMPELYLNDKLHFNDKGYAVWSAIIKKRLDEILKSN